MQLGTVQYNAKTFDTMQLHSVSCMSECTHVYNFLAGLLSSDIFHCPTPCYLTTRLLSLLPYSTLPESEKPLPFRACLQCRMYLQHCE